MPVVVTGASGFIGRWAVRAFALASPQVRAYVRRPEAAEQLRAEGIRTAIGGIEDVENLEVVMSGAHTVCHLVGGLRPRPPDDYDGSIVGSVGSVIEAATRAGVSRLLYLSSPGASTAAANPYLRSKGMAEDLIKASGLAHVIVRCAHVYGPGSGWLDAVTRRSRMRPALVIGSGRQLLAPVYVEDVAAVLGAADHRDRIESGTWGLEGPDRISADDLADLLAGAARSKRRIHLSARTAARTARLTGDRMAVAAWEVLAADSLADAPDAAGEFGVRRTPLREGLARSLQRDRE
jgi:uncharacterized protein YbjT (DUF2867 family)